jgi:hypothetical protein
MHQHRWIAIMTSWNFTHCVLSYRTQLFQEPYTSQQINYYINDFSCSQLQHVRSEHNDIQLQERGENYIKCSVKMYTTNLSNINMVIK